MKIPGFSRGGEELPEPAPLRVRVHADRSEGERLAMLRVPAGAYVLDTDQSVIFQPGAAERFLLNPDTEGYAHEPWPFAGLEVEGGPPARCLVSQRVVETYVRNGWAELEGAALVKRPGGPPDDPWRTEHVFLQGSALVLFTRAGNVRYRVERSPDKWPDQKNEAGEGFGGDVHWTFDLVLERG